MNVLIVDTSAWIEYFRGKPCEAIDTALKEGRAYLCPLVVSELISGFKPESKRQSFIEFLCSLPLTNSAIQHWIAVGELRYKLQLKGLNISVPDAHIAQSSIELDGYLLSLDKIFLKISRHIGLKLVDF